MNKIKHFIIIVIALISIAAITVSCSKQEEETRLAQEIKNIETFLRSNALHYTIDNHVYKSITDSTLTDNKIAEKGDSIFFDYAIFSFSSRIETLYDTNNEEIADLYNIDKTFLKFKLKEVELGTTPMVLGLQTGLYKSKVGDTFMLLMPSTMGYGKHWNGYVPPFTPLYIWVSIKNIK